MGINIYIQILSTILSFIIVILAVHQKTLKWILTIISNILAIIVYKNSGLNVKSIITFIFILNSFYGLYKWYFFNKKSKHSQITKLSFKNFLYFILIFLILSIIIGRIEYLFSKNKIAYIEAFSLYSILAHYLMAKKKIETWIIWIFIDSIFFIICINKALYIFAIKYFIYVLLAIYGYFIWKKNVLNSNNNRIL